MVALVPIAAALIVLVGLQSAFFLWLFDHAWRLWLGHPFLIYFLPLAGLTTVAAHRALSSGVFSTARVILTLREKHRLLRWFAAPMAMVFTCISQAFGASTGREGTAIQVGAATADALLPTRWTTAKPWLREFLARGGIAAGFGAIFGTPAAGAVFAFECDGRHRRALWLPWLATASYGAWGVRRWLLPQAHTLHLEFEGFDVVTRNWGAMLVLALALGIYGRAFRSVFLNAEHFFRRRNPYVAVLISTLTVVLLTSAMDTRRYNDLGLTLIDHSLNADTGWKDPLWKSLFTIVSATGGLKGGEVTPILSIGAAIGRAVADAMGAPVIPLVGLGLVAFFAAVAGVPLTGALLAAGFFGPSAILPAFIVGWIASFLVGREKLYKGHEY